MSKLIALDKNAWNYINVYTSFVFDKNTLTYQSKANYLLFELFQSRSGFGKNFGSMLMICKWIVCMHFFIFKWLEQVCSQTITGCGSEIWNNFKTFFFSLIRLILEKKKRDKSKYSWLTQLFKLFFNKIQLNLSEQKKQKKT